MDAQGQARMHRVRAVAERLDVSVATVYRAVESGALRALKIGRSAGAIRIPESAVVEYIAACEQAAAAGRVA